MPTNENKPTQPSGLPGLTAAACFLAGAAGLFCALVSITMTGMEPSAGHGPLSDRLGFGAGLLANATFRK